MFAMRKSYAIEDGVYAPTGIRACLMLPPLVTRDIFATIPRCRHHHHLLYHFAPMRAQHTCVAVMMHERAMFMPLFAC